MLCGDQSHVYKRESKLDKIIIILYNNNIVNFTSLFNNFTNIPYNVSRWYC